MNDTTKLDSLSGARVYYYPVYRRLVGGSWPAAIALSHIVYWWYYSGGRGFFMTDSELADALYMTLNEVRTAKARLRHIQGLTIARKGQPARTFYDLDPAEFAEAIMRAMQGGTQ